MRILNFSPHVKKITNIIQCNITLFILVGKINNLTPFTIRDGAQVCQSNQLVAFIYIVLILKISQSIQIGTDEKQSPHL